MDDLYSFRSDDVAAAGNLPTSAMEEEDEEELDLVKKQIANHPLYPDLLSACAECRKIGAPPELCEIMTESNVAGTSSSSGKIGDDPELDKFMEVYCEALTKLKAELVEIFDEASRFLIHMESELSDLCKHTLTTYQSDEAAGSSEDDLSCGEVEAAASEESCGSVAAGEQELKGMLLRKYSGYLGNLRKEFLKKRKKGKLSNDARLVLMDWWNTHHRWPYPTEEDKANLSEATGLDQKQISNWFINQRKRHWKPAEDMRFALIMEGVDDGCCTTQAPRYPENPAGTGNLNAYTNNN